MKELLEDQLTSEHAMAVHTSSPFCSLEESLGGYKFPFACSIPVDGDVVFLLYSLNKAELRDSKYTISVSYVSTSYRYPVSLGERIMANQVGTVPAFKGLVFSEAHSHRNFLDDSVTLDFGSKTCTARIAIEAVKVLAKPQYDEPTKSKGERTLVTLEISGDDGDIYSFLSALGVGGQKKRF